MPDVRAVWAHEIGGARMFTVVAIIQRYAITAFGSYGRAIIVSTIYLVGIVAAPFFPETRGRPLPD